MVENRSQVYPSRTQTTVLEPNMYNSQKHSSVRHIATYFIQFNITTSMKLMLILYKEKREKNLLEKTKRQ